jgi:hypothetical protein
MTTKKRGSKKADTLRGEYELSKLKNPVRGKHYAKAKAGSNLVLLDADLARSFPNAAAVNRALRRLVSVRRSKVRRSGKARRPSA